MPVVKSEFSCPRCKMATGKLNQIVASAGTLQCSVNSTHIWPDASSFYAENPTMDFKVAPPSFPPQENYAPMSVSVPIAVKSGLEAKYGDKVGATVSAMLQVLLEGDTLIVPEADLRRIADKLGAKPRSSSELYGMIFALGEEVTEQKSIAETAQRDVKAYEGLSIGRVVVDLGDEYAGASEKAKSAQLPLAIFITQNIKQALRDNWF